MWTRTAQSPSIGSRWVLLPLALGGLLVGCVPRSGVEAPLPARGDTVRVTNGPTRTVYEFRELRGDLLSVRDGDQRVNIMLVSPDDLEAIVGYRGRIGNALRGGGWGLVAGAGLGTILGLVPECRGWICSTPVEGLAFGAMVLAGPGALLGLIIGLATPPTPVWAPVDWTAMDAQVQPSAVGLGFQLGRRP